MNDKLSTEEIVKIAAKAASNATMERLEKERQKEKVSRYDRRLYNTKLLLRNYRMLAAYIEEAVYTPTAEDENAIDILDCMCADSKELNPDEYKDDKFDCMCSRCGFRFNKP